MGRRVTQDARRRHLEDDVPHARSSFDPVVSSPVVEAALRPFDEHLSVPYTDFVTEWQLACDEMPSAPGRGLGMGSLVAVGQSLGSHPEERE